MVRVADSALIDVVDDSDRVIGTVARRDARSRGANFRTAHVLLVRDDDLLLQRLAPGRDRHQGRWGATVAAYVAHGETYAEAAERRLADELGVEVPLRQAVHTSMRDGRSRKFVELFVGPFAPVTIAEPDHVAAVEVWSRRDVTATIESDPEIFTPTFASLFAAWSGTDVSPT